MKKLLSLLIVLPLFVVAQHKITGSFTPADQYKQILLYKNTPKGINYVKGALVDSTGRIQIELTPELTKGIYKLIYSVPQDRYNFDFIYNGTEDVEFTFDEKKGINYVNSKENKLLMSYTRSMGMVNQSIGDFYRQQSKDSTALLSIFTTLKRTQEEYETSSQGLMVANFIKANRPYLPKTYEPLNAYLGHIKDHYFDHIDFNNEVLLSSNFLIDRVLNYVFGMSGDGATDSEVYINNIKELSKYLQPASKATQKLIYSILWEQLATANYEEAANFITNRYLMKLAESLEDYNLLVELTKFEDLSLGKLAPDFNIRYPLESKMSSSSLHNLKGSEYYILVFWSSECSHCLEELPELQAFIKEFDEKQVKVVAFGLEVDEAHWKSESSKYPEFLHGIGLGKWSNEIGVAYNISSTPTYFILDKAKNFFAKPGNLEELKTVLR